MCVKILMGFVKLVYVWKWNWVEMSCVEKGTREKETLNIETNKQIIDSDKIVSTKCGHFISVRHTNT